MMRQIRQLVQAIAGVRAAIHDQVDLDSAGNDLDGLARGLMGLSLSTLDRLPLPAILATVAGIDPEKRAALAQIFEAAAELAQAQGDPQLARRRNERSEAIRAIQTGGRP